MAEHKEIKIFDPDVHVKKRSIILAIVLTIVTAGLYSLYWIYKLTGDVHALSGKKSTASGGWVLFYMLITLGIYYFYWMYKMGDGVVIAKERRELRCSSSIPVIYILLSLFGLGIVAKVLMQSEINEMAEGT